MSTALGGFDTVTAVQRNGPGRYRARVDPAWDGPGSPLGGVGAVTILRAMLAELAAAEFAPGSVTVHFSRPLVHGAAEIRVETLRRGHHLATVQAHTVQEGSFAALRWPPSVSRSLRRPRGRPSRRQHHRRRNAPRSTSLPSRYHTPSTCGFVRCSDRRR